MLDPYKSKPEGWRGEVLPAFKDSWSARALLAASFISPGARVLDLGCGAGQLREFLQDGCSWEGYDLRPLHIDVRPIDLDAGEFPSGSYDYVVLLGVLDWLREPVSILKRARASAPHLIVSNKHRHWKWYAPTKSRTAQLEKLLPGTGWSISKELEWGRDDKNVYSVCQLA